MATELMQVSANFLYTHTPPSGYVSSISPPRVSTLYYDAESKHTYVMVMLAACVTCPLEPDGALPEPLAQHVRAAATQEVDIHVDL